MTMQLTISALLRQAAILPGEATLSLLEALDDDVRERMIVERSMRPRSWERCGDALADIGCRRVS